MTVSRQARHLRRRSIARLQEIATPSGLRVDYHEYGGFAVYAADGTELWPPRRFEVTWAFLAGYASRGQTVETRTTNSEPG